MFFQSIFENLIMKKLRYKYYNKHSKTRVNGNVKSRDQEESKLNSTIDANSGAHALTQKQHSNYQKEIRF